MNTGTAELPNRSVRPTAVRSHLLNMEVCAAVKKVFASTLLVAAGVLWLAPHPPPAHGYHAGSAAPYNVYLPSVFNEWDGLPCGEFFDAFNNPASGWPVGENEGLILQYMLEGEYQVIAKQPGYSVLVRAPTCKQQNYSVGTEARWASQSGSYGLLFGLTEDFSQYYLFVVNDDWQEYALYYVNNNEYRAIVPETATPVIQKYTRNYIKAMRFEDLIILEINGKTLGSWSDASITGPTYVGLANLPYLDMPYADLRFNNFLFTPLISDLADLADRRVVPNAQVENPQTSILQAAPPE